MVFEHARPRSPGELAKLPARPDVVAAAKERGVTRVVHFTTARGLVGILAKRAVMSRKRLPEEKYLEHIYRPNAANRKDGAWLDYVNLSVERINDWMFVHSERWHAAERNPWVILSFDPEILGHPGVVFTTTNNIYPACERAEGIEGFSRMFADRVYGRCGERHFRNGKQPSWPTDRQAEVLYPRQVCCDHLLCIGTQKEQTIDMIAGALAGALKASDIDVCVRHTPEEFQ